MLLCVLVGWLLGCSVCWLVDCWAVVCFDLLFACLFIARMECDNQSVVYPSKHNLLDV